MKIIIAMVVGILISICVVIGIVYVVSESYEKNYIGLWSYESTGKEIKVVKTKKRLNRLSFSFIHPLFFLILIHLL